MNFDQYQPIDPGVCGEPYAPLAVCQLTSGLIAHGYLGVGLAGAILPPDPWNDSHGLEYGARLEFRWDRFSFAITDFYGFQDFPYVEQLFSYSRNVDPISGRPRHTMTTERCRTGKESGCLDSDNALTQHSVNQQLFSAICFNTLAVAPTLDPTACLANIFGSANRTMPEGTTAPARRGRAQHRGAWATRSDRTASCCPASPSSRPTAACRTRSRSSRTTECSGRSPSP